jgi:hypothetical protein
MVLAVERAEPLVGEFAEGVFAAEEWLCSLVEIAGFASLRDEEIVLMIEGLLGDDVF